MAVLPEFSRWLFLLQGAGIRQVKAQNEIDCERMGQEASALFFSVPTTEQQQQHQLVSCFRL